MVMSTAQCSTFELNSWLLIVGMTLPRHSSPYAHTRDFVRVSANNVDLCTCLTYANTLSLGRDLISRYRTGYFPVARYPSGVGQSPFRNIALTIRTQDECPSVSIQTTVCKICKVDELVT